MSGSINIYCKPQKNRSEGDSQAAAGRNQAEDCRDPLRGRDSGFAWTVCRVPDLG
jgi:hypothetical protein